MPRIAPAIILSSQQQAELTQLADAPGQKTKIRLRAEIILKAAGGDSNQEISRKLKTPEVTVGKWRNRYVAKGLDGLSDLKRSGRRPAISPERLAQVISDGRRPRKNENRRRTCVKTAAIFKVSKTTIHRIWTSLGVRRKKQRAEKYFERPPYQLKDWADIYSLHITPELWIVTILCGLLNWTWEEGKAIILEDDKARMAEWRLLAGISALSHVMATQRNAAITEQVVNSLWPARPKKAFGNITWHIFIFGGRSGVADQLWKNVSQHPRIRCYAFPAYTDREKGLIAILKQMRSEFSKHSSWSLMPLAETSVYERLVKGAPWSDTFEWVASERNLSFSSGIIS